MEILPGKEGLLHISEIMPHRINAERVERIVVPELDLSSTPP